MKTKKAKTEAATGFRGQFGGKFEEFVWENREEILAYLRTRAGNATAELLEKPAGILEPGNFRIDSVGWAQKTDPAGLRYLENPEGDA